MEDLVRLATSMLGLCVGCGVAAGAVSFSRAVKAGEEVEVCPIPKVAVPRPADPMAWPSWVDSRVKDLQPAPQERKIDRIGWAHTILEAEKLAKSSNRPVFLFTLDGRIDTGRC